MSHSKKIVVLLAGFSILVGATGCAKPEGPAEKVGRQIDEAAERSQAEWEKTKVAASQKYNELEDKADQAIEYSKNELSNAAKDFDEHANQLRREAGKKMEEAGREMQDN